MLPSLLDRLGDSKDSVREQDQTLLLKIMEQAANPQVCLAALCSVSEWQLKKENFFCWTEGFLLWLCWKWLNLPMPCYEIFASIENAGACQDTHGWECKCRWVSQGGMGGCQASYSGSLHLLCVSRSIVLASGELLREGSTEQRISQI